MYEVNARDERVLFRVKDTDPVSKLTMLKPQTIEALERAHIKTVGDLYNASIWKINGISEAEKEKLDEVCRFLLSVSDGLHG